MDEALKYVNLAGLPLLAFAVYIMFRATARFQTVYEKLIEIHKDDREKLAETNRNYQDLNSKLIEQMTEMGDKYFSQMRRLQGYAQRAAHAARELEQEKSNAKKLASIEIDHAISTLNKTTDEALASLNNLHAERAKADLQLADSIRAVVNELRSTSNPEIRIALLPIASSESTAEESVAALESLRRLLESEGRKPDAALGLGFDDGSELDDNEDEPLALGGPSAEPGDRTG